MSYGIDEGVEDAKERLAFLMEVKTVFPDANLQEGRWCSPTLKVEDCDGAETGGEGTHVYVELYRTVGRGRVYRGWGAKVHLTSFFTSLQDNPELYKNLLEALKRKAI